jgi:AraC-like DNA-binding protein
MGGEKMPVKHENYTFLTSWSDVYVDEYERTSSAMSDYHAHRYYEVSLILSGEVRVLAPGVSSESERPRVILCAPGVPHYITCTKGTAYKRINVVFSEEFISSSREAEEVMGVFKREGNVIFLDNEQANELADIARSIMKENNRFRQRLLLLYYISKISDSDVDTVKDGLPDYISRVLCYIKEKYSEKIIANDLARYVNVGRTTLMTAFKKHTGMTVGEYVLKCRLIAAVDLLSAEVPVRECAERCGFGESCNFIRSFKRHFGMTPRKYMSIMKNCRKNVSSA